MASCLFQNCQFKRCGVWVSRIDLIVLRIDSIISKINSVKKLSCHIFVVDNTNVSLTGNSESHIAGYCDTCVGGDGIIALSSVLSFIGTVNFINNSANDGGGGAIYTQSGNTELIASTGPVISSTTQQVMVMYCKNTWGTPTTILGCPSCISVTMQGCYQIGFLKVH